MSTTVTMYPVVAALLKAQEFIRAANWNAVNSEQQIFLEEFYNSCKNELGLFSKQELESIASWKLEDIVKFLEERGFPCHLNPIDENTFAIASVLKVMVKWIKKGEVTKVRSYFQGRETEFPAVKIDKHLQLTTKKNHQNPVATLMTENGDQVFMTMLDNPPQGFELVKLAELFTKPDGYCDDFDGLIFPMVELDQMVDVSWILNLETADGKWYVSQAKQQTKFKMNEVGAKVESGFQGAVTLRAIVERKQPHVIDKPFLIWFTRKGLSKPYFVGHITQENWKNPGNIF